MDGASAGGVRRIPSTATLRDAVDDRLRRHWRSIAGAGVLFLVGAVAFLALGAVGVLSIPFIVENWNTLIQPALLSVELTSAAFLLGFLGAIPLALLRAYAPRKASPRAAGAAEAVPATKAKTAPGAGRAIRGPRRAGIRRGLLAVARAYATGYVEGIRGTPFFVQLFIVFYFMLVVIPTSDQVFLIAGLVALTLNTIGYQAEVLRGGFQSVGQGQVDAGKSIGMRGRQIFTNITLPQALRLIILPLTNEWISLFKVSALLAFITIRELFFEGTELAVNEGHPLDAFVMMAAMYLIIIIPLSRATSYIERRTRIPGLGVPSPRERRRPVGREPAPTT